MYDELAESRDQRLPMQERLGPNTEPAVPAKNRTTCSIDNQQRQSAVINFLAGAPPGNIKDACLQLWAIIYL